ncbi:hypothetical protein [Salinigranum marinum]|uniref:hypothetical protein n=1 Tax=Salinigranum marinum TaxID=1515595 RepID=UPI002989A9F3|nr:hypothetical protein [Salinigranum marinum]
MSETEREVASGESEQTDAQPDISLDEPVSERDQMAMASERVQQLRAENGRLRREYQHAKRVEYGRTAIGLAAVGVVAVGGAALFPSVREVLLIIGSIGLFSAVLTRFLTPERFLPVDVAEGIYDSVDETRGALVAELELVGDAQYVPTEGPGVRLYVPQREAASLPDSADLQSTLVVPEDDDRRGVAFSPSGKTLFREFRRTLSGSLGDTPRSAARQLAEGASEGLELVDSANVEVDTAGQRVTMRLSGVPFGAVDRMDHPIVSFVGVGLATGLQTAVSVADARRDGDESVVTFTWDGELETERGDAETEVGSDDDATEVGNDDDATPEGEPR